MINLIIALEHYVRCLLGPCLKTVQCKLILQLSALEMYIGYFSRLYCITNQMNKAILEIIITVQLDRKVETFLVMTVNWALVRHTPCMGLCLTHRVYGLVPHTPCIWACASHAVYGLVPHTPCIWADRGSQLCLILCISSRERRISSCKDHNTSLCHVFVQLSWYLNWTP